MKFELRYLILIVLVPVTIGTTIGYWAGHKDGYATAVADMPIEVDLREKLTQCEVAKNEWEELAADWQDKHAACREAQVHCDKIAHLWETGQLAKLQAEPKLPGHWGVTFTVKRWQWGSDCKGLGVDLRKENSRAYFGGLMGTTSD